jgi:hypothetical protein
MWPVPTITIRGRRAPRAWVRHGVIGERRAVVLSGGRGADRERTPIAFGSGSSLCCDHTGDKESAVCANQLLPDSDLLHSWSGRLGNCVPDIKHNVLSNCA